MKFLTKYSKVKLDEEALALLQKDVDNFVFAGGVISLADWESLSADEVAALISAKDRLDRRTAYFNSLAQTPEGLALLQAANDDGAALIDRLLSRAADAAVVSMGKKGAEVWR